MLTLYPITPFKLTGGGSHLIMIALDDVFSTLTFKGGFKTNPEKKVPITFTAISKNVVGRKAKSLQAKTAR